jgi:predicted outer membrane repeat protein
MGIKRSVTIACILAAMNTVAIPSFATGVNYTPGMQTSNITTNVDRGGVVYQTDPGDVTIGANGSLIDFNNNLLEANSTQPKNVYGGAIANWLNGSTMTVYGNFNNNTAQTAAAAPNYSYGGAIYNANYGGGIIANLIIGEGSTFNNNTADFGGAILNDASATNNSTLTIQDGVVFSSNTASQQGGAILTKGTMNIGQNVIFEDNSALNGGAIFSGKASNDTFTPQYFTVTVGDGAQFNNNSAEDGGAIYTNVNSAFNLGDNVSFTNNNASGNGGAIASLSPSGVSTGINSVFEGNSAASGGAVYTGSPYAFVDIGRSAQFISNSADYGGAIYNGGTTSTLTNAVFTGNTAEHDGGAIYNDSNQTLILTGSTFTNNSAGGNGGAIYSATDLRLQTSGLTGNNIIFSGNTAADGGDIYMATQDSTLTLLFTANKTAVFASGISGNANGYNMNILALSPTSGAQINSYINNANIQITGARFHLAEGSSLNNSTITMNGGTLNTIDGSTSSFDSSVLTIYSAGNAITNLMADVNVGTGKGDDFSNATTTSGEGRINVLGINPVGTVPVKDYISINLSDALGLSNLNVPVTFTAASVPTVLTPIRYLQGAVTSAGELNYSPVGNSYKDFNPAVMVSPVAAQLGGFFTQLNAYNQAFGNVDMNMLMTQEERKAMRMNNSYASADETNPMVFSPTFLPQKEKGVWARPYATFERVGLRGGPGVSNVMYGTFFGGDSEIKDLGNGYEGQFSLYAGYNGSHQTYNGVSLYQNGGSLGVTGVVYKGNFFSALTANAGANVVDASAMYGSEDFAMLMAGVASKTGYNWELAKGKFIIQPSYMMSYSFVNSFDYTNAAGIRITSSPLNAIQVVPGIKFIGNLKNGWQPYIGATFVYNIMDTTDFQAAQTSLPNLSVKPYVEYGLGVQKRWGERFTGFVQSMFRSGGRNGVAFTFGFRVALGKAPAKSDADTARVVIKSK